jgi:hypothetical protein
MMDNPMAPTSSWSGASDRSSAWRPGRRIGVRYRGVSGDLICSTWIVPDGQEQEVDLSQ